MFYIYVFLYQMASKIPGLYDLDPLHNILDGYRSMLVSIYILVFLLMNQCFSLFAQTCEKATLKWMNEWLFNLIYTDRCERTGKERNAYNEIFSLIVCIYYLMFIHSNQCKYAWKKEHITTKYLFVFKCNKCHVHI